MRLTRISFLKGTLAMGALAVTGCGDDTGGGGGSGSGGSGMGGDTGTGSDTGTGTGTGGSCTAAIATNHGHTMTVSQADVDAGVDKTYAIGGSSPHDHNVVVTAADFATLAGGGSVSLTSDDGGAGHTHAVSVSCT